MNNKIYQGHFLRKRFGQIFLTDPYIINNIIKIFNPKDNQEIIEIGPGLGVLTLPLMKYVKHMTVIELDRNLAFRLMKNPKLKHKLTILQNDAMKIDFGAIARSKGKQIRILGNLPYNISIPLIFHLFNYIHTITDMCFMLQKEVINRLITKKNMKTYGHLSIMTQYYCQIEHILTVPPSSFTPSPKVESGIVRLIPHKKNYYPICNIKILNAITKLAFSQRRKIITNSLKKLFSIQDFKNLNINPNSRAENISIKKYCKLANLISKNKINYDRFIK
ncbi:16S rRNA (adenine(1518)-N(6)/adenine(1519)-N(6))-dimethyltransferase RsmA [Arsenophonus symbiont of Ornithomya chloropus]|uniref:16S rRNA (adenine(1518)-N(6)/adenine(1519)-N(6))- dimethyltransferase RsmA n=1 Tax=Arsenophonus symbiont of Ornithomya chloropus TaxID=634121 RepID=UPI0032B1BF3A